jgi:hypothetical protein
MNYVKYEFTGDEFNKDLYRVELPSHSIVVGFSPSIVGIVLDFGARGILNDSELLAKLNI